MRISRAKSKIHNQANDLIHSDKPLTKEQKIFILDNWSPAADHDVGKAGVFFTPKSVAKILVNDAVPTVGKGIDIGAGIGRLTWEAIEESTRWDRGSNLQMFAIEINHAFVEIGKRIMPQVNWITSDFLEKKTWDEITANGEDLFSFAIGNPPFGKIPTRDVSTAKWLFAANAPLDLMAVEIALRYTKPHGGVTMVMPSSSCRFSFRNGEYMWEEGHNWAKFVKALPGITCDLSAFSIDQHAGDWEGVKPCIDLALFSKEQCPLLNEGKVLK